MTLGKAGLIERLFKRFSRQVWRRRAALHVAARWLMPRWCRFPKQRNSREENEAVRRPARRKGMAEIRRKTGRKTRMRAGPRSTGADLLRLKNHVNTDAKHKLIRHYEVTDASVHDSRKFYGLLNKTNTSGGRIRGQRVSLQSRPRAELRGGGLRSRIDQRASRIIDAIESTEDADQPEQQVRNSRRARVRCSANIAGWSDCTDDRYRAGESPEDWPGRQPGLQHPPACNVEWMAAA